MEPSYFHIAPVIISVMPKSKNAPPITPIACVELAILKLLFLYPEALHMMIRSSLSFDTCRALFVFDTEPISPSPSLVTEQVVPLGSRLKRIV